MSSLWNQRSLAVVERPLRELLHASGDFASWHVLAVRQALGTVVTGYRAGDRRAWVWLVGAVTNWLIFGGVLAVPLAAVCAAIGALMPSGEPIHQHTGSIFAFAMLWFLSALLAVQFQRRRVDDRAID